MHYQILTCFLFSVIQTFSFISCYTNLEKRIVLICFKDIILWTIWDTQYISLKLNWGNNNGFVCTITKQIWQIFISLFL